MRFLYPLGLLGLIGIPILIIIYIIKNKYTEQTITSTYIWELSEKFLKRKKPISKLKGLILLILECLAVLAVSLLIAHPVFILKGAANEYCFILDGSGSMNIMENNQTRFDDAKDEIDELIKKSADGSTYTLIYIGNSTRVVYERLSSKARAVEMVDKLSTGYLSTTCTDALKYAQSYFNDNPSVKTYLITDKEYETENITLVNIAESAVNYSILDASYESISARYDADGKLVSTAKIVVTSTIISYTSDKDVNVSLYVDNTLAETKNVSLTKLSDTEVTFTIEGNDFDSLRVKIEDEDQLLLDNERIIYNTIKEHDYSALIVSETPFYIKSVIQAFGVTKLDVIKPIEYNSEKSGYGLYIFDSFTPSELPTDGAVWLFNPVGSTSDSGFSYKETIKPDDGAEMVLAKGSSSIYKKLTDGMLDLEMYTRTYNVYGLYRDFTSLVECDGESVIFTGSNVYGNREIVFAFDLHETNLPLSYNFLALFRNLLSYSFPAILEESSYTAGDKLVVNILPSIKSVRIDSPLGNTIYLETSSSTSEYVLTEVGNYTISVTMKNDAVKKFKVYSAYPDKENDENDVVKLVLNGTQENNNQDGTYDNLFILYILLALLFVADWLVYCYEQYQLR